MDKVEYSMSVCQISSSKVSTMMWFVIQHHHSVCWKNVKIYAYAIAPHRIIWCALVLASISSRAAEFPRTAAVRSMKNQHAIWHVNSPHPRALGFWCWCQIVSILRKFAWHVCIVADTLLRSATDFTWHMCIILINALYFHSKSTRTWMP